MPAIKMTINLPDSIRQQLKLAPWGNRQATSAICKAIDRYNLIISKEIKAIQEVFSLSELNLIFELCKKISFIPADKCKDAILLEAANSPDDLFFHARIDRNQLIEKLKNLSLIQNVALVEFIESANEK